MEGFDIVGLTGEEAFKKLINTMIELNYQAFKAGYREGHKDGMQEAVTTITE